MEAGTPSVAIHVQSVADMADGEGDGDNDGAGAQGPHGPGGSSKDPSPVPTPQRVLSPVGSLDNVIGGNGGGLGGGGPVTNDDDEDEDGDDDLQALLNGGRAGSHRRCCRACGRWTPWIWFFTLWLGAWLITGGVCLAVEPSASVVGVTVVAWSVLLISVTLAFLGAYALVTVGLVLVEEPLLLVRNWLYFALAVKGPVVLILWSFACLALWLTFPFWCLLGICNADANLSRTGPATSLVVSLIVTGFAWLLKNLAIKMTAVRFHQGAYFDRLHDALFAEYALQQLLAVLQVAPPRRGTVAPPGPATGKGGPRGSLFGRASTVVDARSMAYGGSDPLASGTTTGDARLPWAAGRAPGHAPAQQQQQQQQQPHPPRIVVEHPATVPATAAATLAPPLNPAELLSLRLSPREDRERHSQAAHPLLARGAPGGTGGGGGLSAMAPHDDGDADSDDDDPAAPLHPLAPTSAAAAAGAGAGTAANTTARGTTAGANNLRQRATLNAAAAAQATGLSPPSSTRTSPGPGPTGAPARPAEARSLRAWFLGSSSHGHPVGVPEPPLYQDGSIRTASPGPGPAGPSPRGNTRGEDDGTGSSADLRGSVARVQRAVDFVMRNKLRMVTETGSGGRHVTEIETSRQARALGTSLYRAMRARCEGRNSFTEYDFITLFPRVQYRHARRRRSPGMPGPGAGMLGATPSSVAARVAEAAAHTEIVAGQIFRLFDHNADGIVTCADMRETVQAVYRERKVLALTLKDSNTIIDALDRIATTVVVIILVFVWLAIFGVDALSLIVTVSSLLVSFAFAIGPSLLVLVNSVVFLFVQHPFDVGDRVLVDGENVLVHKVSLYTTVFRRWDEQLIYIPNSQLALKTIFNVRRSGHQWHSISLDIDYDTPIDKIQALERRIGEELRQYPQYIYPNYDFGFGDVTLTNRLTLYLWVRQTQNFQDLGFRWTARKHIMLSLRKALLELDIRYYPPVQKIEWIGADKVSNTGATMTGAAVPTMPAPNAGPAMMAAARADPVAPTVAPRPPDTFVSP